MAAFKAHASFGFWDRNALLSTKEFEGLAAKDREGMGQSMAGSSRSPTCPTRRCSTRRFARPCRASSPATARSAPRKPPKPEAEVPASAGRSARAGRRRQKDLHRLPAQLPPRILRMDRRGQTPGDARQAHRRDARLAARRQAPQLEIRELLSGGRCQAGERITGAALRNPGLLPAQEHGVYAVKACRPPRRRPGPSIETSVARAARVVANVSQRGPGLRRGGTCPNATNTEQVRR
jgi:hypothetical protein